MPYKYFAEQKYLLCIFICPHILYRGNAKECSNMRFRKSETRLKIHFENILQERKKDLGCENFSKIISCCEFIVCAKLTKNCVYF